MMMHRNGMLAAALVTVVAATAVVIAGRGGQPYLLRARFATVDGLKPAFDVRIHGARVGSVRSLHLAPDDSVIATLAIDRGATPVGMNAAAHIRDANLLGGKFVDVDPGDTTAPAPSGAVIPESRTGAPVDMDQVLDVLDPETRARLGILINAFGTALDGRGRAFGDMLHQLPPSLDRTAALLHQFSSDNIALGRLLDESGRLVAAIAPERRELGTLVDNARGALAATASRRLRLAATIRSAPGVVEQFDRTLTRLDTTFTPLRGAAVALQRSAAPLTGVLGELPDVEPSAVAALDELQRSAPALTDLGRGATPFARQLRPAAATLARFAGALDPVTATFDAGAVDVLRTMEGWARSIQVRDGASHMFRNELVFSPDLVAALSKGFLRARHRTATALHPRTVVPRPPHVAPPRPRPVTPPRVAVPQVPAPPHVGKLPLPSVPAPPPHAGDPSSVLDYLLGP